MKRFSVAMASALTVLIVGTAAARVPDGRPRSPSVRISSPAGPSKAAAIPFRSEPDSGPGSGALLELPGVDDLDPETLVPGDLNLPGLPAELVDMLTGSGAEAVTDETANAADAEAAAILDAVDPPAEVPAEPPAAPALSRRAAAPVRPAAEGSPALFPGLPATGHAGYGSGTVIHSDALQSGTNRLVDLEVAFSGATFTSSALGSAVTNEVARIVAPALEAGNAFGRGTGLEAGLATTASGENPIVLPEKVEAKAPPSTNLISKEFQNVAVAPAAAASVLRGQAQSRAAAACTTGVDLSYGQGYVADLGLLQTAAGAHLLASEAAAPARAVSQSTSATRLVPQAGAPAGPIRKFGLQSESRQTIAPVTFLQGTENQFTLEFAGEFVLRATADGMTGSVFYGPGTVTPETPLLRVLDKVGAVTNSITAQQFFGPEGLNVPIPGVAEIAIGENPRAINGDAASKPSETATLAAGAVDVVRVKLLEQGTVRAADVRIGHLEAAVAVPAGGIECGIGIVKKAIPELVKPGQEFTWQIKVSNPNDCVLSSVKVVDTISATDGIVYSIVSSNPKADSTSTKGLTFNDIGAIEPGQSRDLSIKVRVSEETTKAGNFTDEALVTGVCGPASADAGAGVGVPLEAKVTINVPGVLLVRGAALTGELPRTGAAGMLLPALALTGMGLLLRGAVRRRRTAASQ